MSVEGKIAFITGGASGIGLAIAKELLENGARGVSIIDINEDYGLAAIKEIEKRFGHNKAIFIKADVSDKSQLERNPSSTARLGLDWHPRLDPEAFERTVEIYEQLDIVFNNAGIADEVNWEKTLAVNLGGVIQGTFLAMQKYLPKYKSGDEGVIVNTSSVAAFKGLQFFPIYNATKQGVVSLGRSLGGSEYYKKYKVRIVTMCPGAINTPSLQTLIRTKAVPLSGAFEKLIEHILNTAQEPESVGENFIEILKNAKNGSVWMVADGNPPYEVPVPELKELHKQ